VNQNALRPIAGISERMNHSFGSEQGCTLGHFDPHTISEKLGATLEQEEPFIFVPVVMWRRADARCLDRREHRISATGLLCVEMNDQFATKSSDHLMISRQRCDNRTSYWITHFGENIRTA
jgi:hypothetical protein